MTIYLRCYKIAVAIMVLLLSGCNNDDEHVELHKPAEPGTMKAKVNGKEISTLSDATNAQATSVVRMEISGTTGQDEMLSLVLPVISKPGTYDSITVGRYVIFSNGSGLFYKTWTAQTAKLTVTKFDIIAIKISGTFFFLATPGPDNTGSENKGVAEGSFTDLAITR